MPGIWLGGHDNGPPGGMGLWSQQRPGGEAIKSDGGEALT